MKTFLPASVATIFIRASLKQCLLALVGVGCLLHHAQIHAAEHQVEFISHRGLMKFAPENSLLSFQIAYERGFRFIEIDVVVTGDGRLIAFHDTHLKKFGSPEKIICNLNYPQIKALPLGKRYLQRLLSASMSEVSQMHRYADPWVQQLSESTIPTLEEIFEHFGKRVRYQLDVKNISCLNEHSPTDDLLKMIKTYGLQRQVWIESRDLNWLQTLVSTEPDIQALYWNSNILSFDNEKLNKLRSQNIRHFDFLWTKFNQEGAKRIGKQQLFTFTVNEPEAILKLQPYVSYIITDLDIYADRQLNRFDYFNLRSTKVKLAKPGSMTHKIYFLRGYRPLTKLPQIMVKDTSTTH